MIRGGFPRLRSIFQPEFAGFPKFVKGLGNVAADGLAMRTRRDPELAKQASLTRLSSDWASALFAGLQLAREGNSCLAREDAFLPLHLRTADANIMATIEPIDADNHAPDARTPLASSSRTQADPKQSAYGGIRAHVDWC